MAWLPDGEKVSKISLFVLAQLANVTDGRTDRQTDTACRHIPRLCIALRGKNASKGIVPCYKYFMHIGVSQMPDFTVIEQGR